MPKIAQELSVKAVEKLAKLEGRHNVGGCSGLYLRVTETGAASWVLRIKLKNGRRADVGLGSFSEVSLQRAREEGRRLRKEFRDSNAADPADARKDAKAQAKAEAEEQRKAAELARVTFEKDARDLHVFKSKEFKNTKHAAQWIKTLETYAFPILGHMEVRAVELSHVLKVLEPIWTTKPETATRVRQRIEAVLDYARIKKHRTGDNPARWGRDGLASILPNPSKLKKRSSEHHPALPWKLLPAFLADLRAREATGAKALELAILTAARSSEVRLATWREFDLEAGLWTAPAEHMKSGLPHKVPLTGRALELVKLQPKGKPDDLVFPSDKGKPLSDNTLSKLMKDMHAANLKAGGAGYVDPNLDRIATPHGTARSSFKDWCRQTLRGRFDDEVSELQLAHVSDDKTRAAYARNELLELRAELMKEWDEFLTAK